MYRLVRFVIYQDPRTLSQRFPNCEVRVLTVRLLAFRDSESCKISIIVEINDKKLLVRVPAWIGVFGGSRVILNRKKDYAYSSYDGALRNFGTSKNVHNPLPIPF